MSAGNKYVLIKNTFTGVPKFVKPEEVRDKIDANSDWYESLYMYEDRHVELYKKQGHIRGVRDVKSNRLFFDLDSKGNLERAQSDALKLVDTLNSSGIKSKDISVYFSSSKGFHVNVDLTKDLTPMQLSYLAKKFAKGLTTFDPSLYDAAQIIRIPYTKNPQSGMYKIPVTIKDLKGPMDAIQKKASNLATFDDSEFDTPPGRADIDVPNIPAEDPQVREPSDKSFDVNTRPKHWTDYKWALLNAVGVKPDQRHEALMRIVATCRGLGYNEDITYAFCQSFDEKFQASTGKPPSHEIDNIISDVFSDKWNGGVYTYKNDVWLQQYCEQVNIVPDSLGDPKSVLGIDGVMQEFEGMSSDFEKNIIKTGIEEIDNNVLFLTSTHNGILGSPGSAKTTCIIQWLEYLSANNQHCFFYSLDMAESIIGAKLIQRVSGLSFKEAFKLIKTNKAKYEEYKNLITEKFKNVKFIFTAGTTVESIEHSVLRYEEESGNKVRFVGIDYLECLQGPYSDPTANTGFISQQLKDMARKTKVCSVMLLQTQKHAGGGDVSKELLSMREIKGASSIEQSASVVMTLWRSGYNPKFQKDDKYISFAVVKNRFGPLWTDDFRWDGPRGHIGGTLTSEERAQLEDLLQAKKEQKDKDNQEKEEWK